MKKHIALLFLIASCSFGADEDLMRIISQLEARISQLEAGEENVQSTEQPYTVTFGAGEFPEIVIEEDELVGVDAAATPDYVGAYNTNGVLRTDDTIDYADGGNYVTLSVDTTNIINIINTNSTYNFLTNGVYHGQVTWWDTNTASWILSDAPTSPSVLVFDNTDEAEGTVRWQNVPTDYMGVYRGTNDNIVADWLRAH